MTTLTFDYDLIIIGSGAGGSVAASIAAKSGLRVALIEEKELGGDAANWGDVPMKTLLETAHLYHEAKEGSRFGLRTNTLGFNYPSIRAWKEAAVTRTGVGSDKKFYANQGIDVYQGKAHFLTPHEITVNRRHLSGHKFIIASGAHWVAPRIQGLEEVGYLTPRSIIETLRPPKSLLILGDGRYALEVAELMAVFGTKVTILTKASHLLPELDKEVGELLAHHFVTTYGMTILTEAETLSIEKNGLGARTLFVRGGVQKHVKTDEILVATHYAPNTDLGLENASVTYTSRGITVDTHLRTTTKHIYAVGDVIGGERDTHATIFESQVAAQNIVAGNRVTPSYDTMPRVIHTHPEVAHTGLTAREAQRTMAGARHVIVPLGVVARSNVSDHTTGFVQLVVTAHGTVVGGTVVAPHAAELIQEISLAVQHRLTVMQLATTPHVFLSWGEAIRVAAQKLTIIHPR